MLHIELYESMFAAEFHQYDHHLWSQPAWVQNLALLLNGYEIQILVVHQIPHLSNEEVNSNYDTWLL